VGAAFSSDFARKSENSVDTETQREEIVAEVHPVKRIVLVPPAAPGSKGDEGMIRGAMRLFHDLPVAIVNPDPDCAWLKALGGDVGADRTPSEAPGPLPAFAAALEETDALFIVGADVIDGTCGVPAAMDRLDLMRAAQARGVPVYVSCSFRSNVAGPILEELAWHRGVVFLMRDAHSLENLRRQTGLEGHAFPDLSFFLERPETTPISQRVRDWMDRLAPERAPVVGVNFAEHSFRSFSNEHNDGARRFFVDSVLAALDKAFPSASYVLLSNDVRSWPNHPSDDAFAAMALEWFGRTIGEDRAIAVDPAASYLDNISALRHLDLLVTGRMHLSFASFRAGTLPVVLMGVGKGYSSIDKMRGAFITHLGSDNGVVSDIARLEVDAPRLLAAQETRPRLEQFDRAITRECAEAAAWITGRLRTHGTSSPEGRATVAETRRIATAREAFLIRENALDLATGSTHAFFSALEADPGRMQPQSSQEIARRNAAIATNRATETLAAVLRGQDTGTRVATKRDATLAEALAKRDAAIETARAAEALATVTREQAVEAQEAHEAAERRADVLAERVAALEVQVKAVGEALNAAERRAEEAESAPVRHLQSLVDAGDRLAEDLRRANARPWRPLKGAIQRGVLRLALGAGPLLPERRRARLRRSLDKRLPSAPGRVWDTVVTGVLDEAGVSLPQRNRPTDRMRSTMSYRALNLLAEISEPFSKRRAQRFRRSAAKRAPDNFRQVSAPLQISGDGAGAAPVADPQRAKRILVADYRLPRADVSAGERATVGLLGDLVAVGYEVVFLPMDMAEDRGVRARLEGMGVEVITGADGFGFPAAYIREHGHRFGSFYLIRVDVAEALLPSARAVAPDARLIFHAPDLHVLRETRAAELGGAPADMARAQETGAREAAIVRAADHVVLVSPAELPLVAEMTDPARISVFPALYSPVPPEPTGHAARQHMFFLGGFGHSANPPAVKWFVNEIWPRVRAALPEAEFHIIGAEAPPDILALGDRPGVRALGYVADLEPVIGTYRLSVVPLQYGAGIKGKIGMALGAGVPTVTTRIGAEGMGIVDGVHALVRDEPEAFADAVIGLYRDAAAWERIARNGRRLVDETFGDLANRAAFLRVLESAGALPLELHLATCRDADPLPLPDPDPELDIDVSVIVPAQDQWPQTRACLNSVALACRGTGLRCEVILADDGSRDETLRAGEFFPGLRVVRQEDRHGKPRACNAAAKAARGGNLVFLDQLSVVMPNWLAALWRTGLENPGAAVVGSKLLFPDGSIREAGGVLFADGSASGLGRGQLSVAPALAHDREVDYVRAASMLVRRDLWDATGGFDEGLAGAECEGPDIAMAARTRGAQVFVSARSNVVGNDGASHRSVPNTPARSTAARNARLYEKWQSQLAASHMAPDTSLAVAAAHAERSVPGRAAERRQGGRLNVLYFSPFPSHPDNHGNQATIQAFGRRFQKLGHKVHFVLLESTIYDDAALRAMRAAWDTFDLLPNARPLWSDGSVIPFDHWYQPGLGEQVAQLCRRYEIDVVFCSYVFQSRLLDFVPDHVLKVIDTHDKMGDRFEMLRRNGQPVEFFSCTPEEEGRYLRRADVVVARRAEEAAYFDSVTGRKSAIVVPHVEEARFLERTFGPVRTVGMVASANQINLAITLELLKALAAREKNGALPFTLRIAGQVSDMIRHLPHQDATLFSHRWVKLLGFVPDIGGFYGSVDLVVSPVTMGTGINVKTVQAMAFGMPLVTTAWGCKGIETGHPMHAHADVESLVDGIFRIAEDAATVNALAQVSRDRYARFLRESDAAIEDLFGRSGLED
jgi:glycosyltransferase involved in cell wall biosynthesis/GT2 family glycosyltransferase/polysaccharide pyruvyl transferase WcaK-like protein